MLDTQYQLVSREEVYGVREEQGYYGVVPNPFGFFGGYGQRPGPYYYGNNGRYFYDNDGRYHYYDNNGRHYYYDNNSRRYVPVPQDGARPWGQYGQSGPYGRDPRYQAPPPRDPYGREYQTPQRIDPGYLWGNRRY
jgi:hypothetical protein